MSNGLVGRMSRKSVYRFSACAEPLHRPVVWTDASAGEGRSEKDMRQRKNPGDTP